MRQKEPRNGMGGGGFITSGVPLVKSETGLLTRRKRRDQRNRQAAPDGYIMMQ